MTQEDADRERIASLAAAQTGLVASLAAALDPDAFAEEVDYARDRARYCEVHERRRLAGARIAAAFEGVRDRYDIVERRFAAVRGGAAYELDGDPQTGRRGITMSAASLGRFLSALLRCRGRVLDLHAMDPDVARSHVAALVRLPPDRRAEFEAETGLELSDPPTVVLN